MLATNVQTIKITSKITTMIVISTIENQIVKTSEVFFSLPFTLKPKKLAAKTAATIPSIDGRPTAIAKTNSKCPIKSPKVSSFMQHRKD